MGKTEEALVAANSAQQSGDLMQLVRAVKLLCESVKELENQNRYRQVEINQLQVSARR